MAITRLRADQQVSQSSITPAELSSSVAGNGLTGGEGTALAVSSSHSSIIVGSSGIKAGGGVISGSVGIANLAVGIVSGSGQVTLEKLSSGSAATDHISEGSTNLYYTDARVKTKLTTEDVVSGSSQVTLEKLSSGSAATTHISEGTNLYYTDARVKSKLTAEDVVSGSGQVVEFLKAQDVVSSSAQIEGATINRLLNNITASGNISASGFISASSFYGSFVEISSSVVFTSGSSIFGDDVNDTHEFTGSTTFGGNLTANGTNINLNGNVNLGDASGDDIDINGRVATSIVPKTNNTHDLGSSALNYRNLHVSGTAHIATLNAAGFTIGGAGGGSNSGTFSNVSASKAEFVNLFASGGKLDGVDIGGTTKGTGSFGSVDIDGGTIDGATIATSNITVGASKTLNVSAGTLTLSASQIDVAKIKGGTFGTGINYSFAGSTIANLGTVTTGIINGGTISGPTINNSIIGNTSAAAGTFTNLISNGNTRLGSNSSDTVAVAGALSSSIIPNADNTWDLGSNSKQFKDLYINGTANIDALSSDTANISSGDFVVAAGGVTTLNAGGNLNIGTHAFSASQFVPTANQGTAPFVVESTTKVTNLNADKLDGQEGIYYLSSSNHHYTTNSVPTSAINGTLSQWTASGADLTRSSNVTITGSLTTTGNITSDGKIYKETLMRSFKFGVTASFKQINSGKFEWKTPEHIRLGSEMVFVNGMLQDSGSNNDYTILNSGSLVSDGAVISFNYKVPTKHSKIKLMYVPK